MLELQQSLGQTKNSAQSATVLLQRLQTPAKASMNFFFLWLQDPSKRGFSLRLEKVTRSFFFGFASIVCMDNAHALHGHHYRHGRHAGDRL